MIMAGSLIDDYGSDEQKSSILEPAISGEMHLALAMQNHKADSIYQMLSQRLKLRVKIIF